MKKDRQPAETAEGDKLEQIKKLAIVAMFDDEELLDQLVLKGGNAMDLVHRISSRASVDLDFSVADDIDKDDVERRVTDSLLRTFELEGYFPFDIKMNARPGELRDELSKFWGGYEVEFKLISSRRADETGRNLETMRREAIQLGEKSRFTIDISRHEFTEGKQQSELGGYTIYVYTPEMIVCEKLRAICQQFPEYFQQLGQGKPRQRARDFVDIEALMNHFSVDLSAGSAHHIVREMFRIKQVPLSLLPRIAEIKDFHGVGFPSVEATVKAGTKLKAWDYYFSFVEREITKLEPLWRP